MCGIAQRNKRTPTYVRGDSLKLAQFQTPSVQVLAKGLTPVNAFADTQHKKTLIPNKTEHSSLARQVSGLGRARISKIVLLSGKDCKEFFVGILYFLAMVGCELKESNLTGCS